jgi:hypothetical protein
VIAAVIAELPFLRRPVALPAAARLWRQGGPAKTVLARELTGLMAAAPACRGRTVHVAADSAYICTELRGLPSGVTLTGPLPRHASLYEVHPELDYPRTPAGPAAHQGRQDRHPGRARRRRSGPHRPRDPVRQDRLRDHLRAPLPVAGRVPVPPGPRDRGHRARPPAGPGHHRHGHPAGQIITRYAGRWAIEVAIDPLIHPKARIRPVMLKIVV